MREEEYIDPVENLENKFQNMGEHVAEHCNVLDDIAFRIEKLEKWNLLKVVTPFVLIGMLFSFVVGYVFHSVQVLESKTDKQQEIRK